MLATPDGVAALEQHFRVAVVGASHSVADYISKWRVEKNFFALRVRA